MTLTAEEKALHLQALDAHVGRREAIAKLSRLRPFAGHPKAQAFIDSDNKRTVVRAGRRGAKTVSVATKAVKRFLLGRRQLYGAPTSEQLEAFWRECKRALGSLIDAGYFRKNETERYIDLPGTEQRLRAKTIYNADTMRGDYADDLYLDEWQLCDEMAWKEVGAPMLLDTDGTVAFIYTPPSLHSSGISRARDPLHAAKLFKAAQMDDTGRWEVHHWTSHDNPFISAEALSEIAIDMSGEAHRREILAEDDDESPNRLIYRAFDEGVCLIAPFEIPGHWPRFVGHDFGGANPAALFLALDPATGYFYAYHEYFPGRGLSTYEHVKAFQRLTEGLTVLKRAGGSHQEDEIRQGYTAQGWPIQEPKIQSVNARIDRVRAIMEKGQFFLFRPLVRLRGELASYLWKADADGGITDVIDNKSAFHMCDAMAYILSDFTPERVRSLRPVGIPWVF